MRSIAIVALCLAVCASCTPALSTHEGTLTRTPSSAVVHTTPSSAVDAFVEAINQADGVMLIRLMSAPAQLGLWRDFPSGGISRNLSTVPVQIRSGDRWSEFVESRSVGLSAAIVEGTFRFDIRGFVVEEVVRVDGEGSLRDVIGTVPDGKTAVVRTLQAPSGEWRVHQIGMGLTPRSSDRFVSHETELWCAAANIDVYPGVECAPLSELEPNEFIELYESKTYLTADEINQLEIAKLAVDASAANMCRALQTAGVRSDDLSPQARAFAQALLEDTCPGSLDVFSSEMSVHVVDWDRHVRTSTLLGQASIRDPAEAARSFLVHLQHSEFLEAALLISGRKTRAFGSGACWTFVREGCESGVRAVRISQEEHLGEGRLGPIVWLGATPRALWRLDPAGPYRVSSVTDISDGVVQVDVEGSEGMGLGMLMTQTDSGHWYVSQIASPSSRLDPTNPLFLVTD